MRLPHLDVRIDVRAALAALALTTGCTDAPTASRTLAPSAPSRAISATETVTGVMSVYWGDRPAPGGQAALGATIRGTSGTVRQVALDDAVVEQAGGIRAVDGHTVEATVDQPALSATAVASVPRVRALRVTGVSGTVSTAGVSGTKRYVVILCRFADNATVPRPPSTYASWIGPTAPGLGDYWRHVSYDRINIDGSTVVGWYTLPQPRAAYLDPNGYPYLGMLADDCTGAADANVDFRAYDGVVTQFSDWLDCCSYGGSYTLTRDGATRTMPFAWQATWADQAVYAHEMGHSLGFPHSSGPYGRTYDSFWDVMSSSYVFYDLGRGGYVQEGTIAYHRDIDGWIPAARKLTMTRGTTRTLLLSRILDPTSPDAMLMVQIPLPNAPNGAAQFYTIEAREQLTYDRPVPGTAVLIHQVNTGRASPAQVVDVDNNGDVNDAGAAWTVGETFTDAANGVTMTVVSRTAAGFMITVSVR